MLKASVRGLLRRLGWEVRRISPGQGPLVPVVEFIQRAAIAVVFDVGANQGQFGKDLRRSGYGGRIISFEPVSDAHRALEASAKGDSSWTVAPRMALGNQEGEVVINVAAYTQTSSLLPPSENLVEMVPESAVRTRDTVRCRRLENVARECLRDGEKALLKLDVQGFEKQVLEGAEAVFSRIAGIYVELSLVPLYKGQALAPEILKYMRQQGYEMWYMTPGFADPRSGRMLQYDVLLARAEHRQMD